VKASARLSTDAKLQMVSAAAAASEMVSHAESDQHSYFLLESAI